MEDKRPGEPFAAQGGPDFGEGLLRWIERTGLQGPASILLELHRPLMPLDWTAAVLAGGVVAQLFGPDYWRKIEALRDPALLDRLLARIDESRA